MEYEQVFEATVENMIRAGEVAGLGVPDLITLLDAGMSIEQLVDYLAAKLTERPVENEYGGHTTTMQVLQH
jgi:hypothetical protein